jgi:hypothetical protein
MVDKIMAAISKTLDTEFGSEYEVYFSEDVRQGMEEPCFFIALLNSARVQRVGLRYRQDNPFAIHYFPSKKQNNFEMVKIAQRLLDVLEVIQLHDGDLIRGTGTNFSINDGVLQFFIDYNVYLKKEIDTTDMRTLKTDMRTN